MKNHAVEGKAQSPDSEKTYLFDNPRNVKRLLRTFYISLLVLLAVDFFVHKHPHFAWETWPEFYAVFGFVACVVLVVAAKYVLRPLVKRREDYYD
ncbi:MAG: hypothetical protein ACLFUT_05050 [Desulfobacteraceae bacterium]